MIIRERQEELGLGCLVACMSGSRYYVLLDQLCGLLRSGRGRKELTEIRAVMSSNLEVIPSAVIWGVSYLLIAVFGLYILIPIRVMLSVASSLIKVEG